MEDVRMVEREHRKLPLILRLALRVAIFLIAWLLIGIAGVGAEHWLGPLHLDWLTAEEVAAQRGGLNMLLILWFCDLLRRSEPRSQNEQKG